MPVYEEEVMDLAEVFTGVLTDDDVSDYDLA